MSKNRDLTKPRNPWLTKISTYLIKSFCKALFGLVLLLVFLGCFGLSAQAVMLWNAMFPWVIRTAIAISCVLTANSISEAL
jgi:uncharacterized membrane protein